MVSRQDVIGAYRLLLGREPENEDVIRHHMKAPTLAALGEMFLSSHELMTRQTGRLGVGRLYGAPPMNIAFDGDPAALARMLAKVQGYWKEIGDSKPHWSVITNDAYLPENIASNEAAFFASGDDNVEAMRSFFERAGRNFGGVERVFELGSGVGRVTSALARRFSSVVGADVSAAHIATAREHLRNNNIGNVTFVHLDGLDALRPIRDFDLFYSTIVLQHNPPPLIERMLDIVLGNLSPGGYAFFQVTTYGLNYRFVWDEYLADASRTMELHPLPQERVLALFRKHGLQLIEVHEDGANGDPNWISCTFFAEKPKRDKLRYPRGALRRIRSALRKGRDRLRPAR